MVIKHIRDFYRRRRARITDKVNFVRYRAEESEKRLKIFYARWERPISSLSLVGGFVFDALTLRRVDALWDNIWVVGHLVIVGVFLILVQVQEIGEGDEKDATKKHFWYVNILQFFFGGILSTYLVFYFRSADILVTWPFILVLVLAFWANESLKRHYIRLSFQISLYFLCLYSFAIFLLPVLFHQIGDKIFLLSGLVSLVVIAVFVLIIFHFSREKFRRSRGLIFSLIAGITLLVNVLYFTNLIPPIPLSLVDGAVYHSLHRDASGNYVVQNEPSHWFNYFNLYQDFHMVSGAPIYAYSAVFSPSNLNLTVLHEWQRYDSVSGKWQTQGTVSLPVVGGREGGFRTFSVWTDASAGLWRVNVKTQSGQLVGRLRFDVVLVPMLPPLVVEVK